ncbi:hypothetical protein LTR36_008591 [Oleoguttula mirabilis]|uniref:SHSP domain-containing protein n=1 Tax=Oleoguttula mirabilis TaxID=1507867 RepID=A0AAV9JT15_9PEZI|nr:hypothetical protein LTR36_008591 [Oleoguttula mirabilis]
MSLFPRFVQNEFAPMFQLLDSYANHMASTTGRNGIPAPSLASTLRSFQPKFDVKENKDSYELHGELPGIDQKNVSIEFTDPQTLSIRGRTEHVREEGQRPAGLIEGQTEQAKITEGGEKESYHKASVEDENTNPDAQKSAEASTESGESTEVAQQDEQRQQPKSDGHKYWLSERSVGEFARQFAFPERVDQENVKASMKNGVLSILVPKAAAPQSRRINIE